MLLLVVPKWAVSSYRTDMLQATSSKKNFELCPQSRCATKLSIYYVYVAYYSVFTFDGDKLCVRGPLSHLIFGCALVFSIVAFMNTSYDQGVICDKYIAILYGTFLERMKINELVED